MCFDCLVAFPPFSSSTDTGAKKALSKLSRPNSPTTRESEEAYGPPLDHATNQEDLPGSDNKDDIKAVLTTEDIAADPDDDGFGEGESTSTFAHGTETNSMDPSTGMELDAVVLVDMESPVAVDNYDSQNHKEEPEEDPQEDPQEETPSEEKYVYEKEVEIETSLDENLPVGQQDDVSSVVTNGTTSTIQSMQTSATEIQNTRKEVRVPGKVVGHLDIGLEYDESSSRLKVIVVQASDLPNKSQGGFSNYRVRIYLRPNKQQSSKTRVRPVDSLVFKELFRFRQLPKDQLTTSELVFKLQGCGKYGKEKLVGDATLNLTALKAADKQSFKVPLVQNSAE